MNESLESLASLESLDPESTASPDVESARSAGQFLRGLFVANIGLGAVGILLGIAEMDLVYNAATRGITQAQAEANDVRQMGMAVLQLALFVATSIVFLVWFRRAHKALPALGGRELKYSPGWAVGGFFVPFLNLIRPVQVMGEVWHGSDPGRLEEDLAPDGPSLRKDLILPLAVRVWWVLYLAYGFVGNILLRMGMEKDQELAQIQTVSTVGVLSDILLVASAAMALVVVTKIQRWQPERWERSRDRIPRATEVAEPVPAPVS